MLSLTNSQRCCLAIQHFGAFRCVVHCIGALVLLCIAILVQFGASVHRRIALVHFGVQLTGVLVFDWLTVHRIGALWCSGELHWCILVSNWLTGQHQHWSKIPGAEPSVRSWVPQLTLMPYLHIFTTNYSTIRYICDILSKWEKQEGQSMRVKDLSIVSQALGREVSTIAQCHICIFSQLLADE